MIYSVSGGDGNQRSKSDKNGRSNSGNSKKK